jgi:hypothetical protein
MRLRPQHIFLLAIIMMMSCHKDTETYSSETIKVHTPLVLKEIVGTVIGYVYDEKNLPVADADVVLYSGATKTNKHGVFTFENIKLDQQGTYIRISKNGFYHASDFIYPAEQSTITYSQIKAVKLENGTSLDANAGGSVSVAGGAKVTFPQGAISDSKGNIYTGKVNVFATYLHPEDRELGNVMPGGLLADAANGNTVSLGTLGMIGVEIRDLQGNKLNVANGKKASIEFPSNTSYKPSEIPLWSFDEVKGRWKEEGKAFLSGNKYTGEVSHFSFWNIDAPFPLVDICGKLEYEDGTPAGNISIKVEADGIGAHFGLTNIKGEFCGKMPKGKRLKITAYHAACKNDISEINVGPFDIKTVLDNIKIKPIKTFKIKGKIQCNNNAVSNGIAIIKVKESTLVIKAEGDGSFSADLSPFLCGEDAPVTIFGFDNKTTDTSPSINVTSTTAQNVILNVCTTTCDLKAELVYDCNNTITANVTGGSGNYTYTWKDYPGKDKFLVIQGQDSIFESKTFCVTVKDLTNNCEKTFCKEVGGKLIAGIEADCENGKLYAYVRGGIQPIKYKWSDGSTDKEFKAQVDGKYCVTITDASGCTTSVCEEISKSINLSTSVASCSKNIFNITSGPFESGKVLGSGLSGNQDLTFPIKIDVFKTGFNFGIQLKSGKCTVVKQYKLPQLLQGVTTSIINTSCSNCLDGKINITLNNNATCFECKIGDIKIFKIDDIANDLSVTNKDGKMAKGEYYVVITDAVSGCYLSVIKVKIQ